MAGGVAGDLTRPETLGPALPGWTRRSSCSRPSRVTRPRRRWSSVDGGRAARRLPLGVRGAGRAGPARRPPTARSWARTPTSRGCSAAAPGTATFLRASGFAANTLGWAPQIRAGDVLRWFHPDARRALVHEADLAAVAVRCLLGDVPAGGRHHLTGPRAAQPGRAAGGHRGRARQAAPVRGAVARRGGAGAGRRVPAGAGRGDRRRAGRVRRGAGGDDPGGRGAHRPPGADVRASGPATTRRTSAEPARRRAAHLAAAHPPGCARARGVPVLGGAGAVRAGAAS